jgi:transcriptional regulator with XRE-family HTH domain
MGVLLATDGRRREKLGVESLGTRLKREREKQNLSLDDVAAATKISARMLRALENDQFDQLPGGIFNKGFVRAYAIQLGLDGKQAVADYLSATGGGPAPKPTEVVLAELATRAAEVRSREKRPSGQEIPWGRLAILLLLVALGFTIWGSYSRKPLLSPAASGSPTAKTAAGAQSTQNSAKPAEFHRDIKLSASVPDRQPAAAPDQAATSEEAEFSVLIRAHADSWLRVVADGKEVLHDLLPANSEKTFSAHRELVVRAGNAGGLDFFFNGRKLPVQGGEDAVKVLTFDSRGLRADAPEVHETSAPAQSQP